MEWTADITHPKPMHFIIRQDKTAGFYIYVYENGHGLYDYLQDTLEIAMDFAFEKFHVPKDAWQRVTG